MSSAGTQAVADRPVHVLTAAAMAEAGLDEGAHLSRHVDLAVLEGVDLVVTAEKAHRAAVLSLRPDLLRRTFTLDELVSLAEATRPRRTDGKVDEALRFVVSARGRHPTTSGDLADPVDAGLQAHHQMVRDVVSAVDRLEAALLTPTGPVSPA